MGKVLEGLSCQFVRCKPELALGLLLLGRIGCYFTMSSICFLGQMLTFIMLARLATLCPAPVLQRVDRLIEPLRATCTAKVSPALPSLDPGVPVGFSHHSLYRVHCSGGLAVAQVYTASRL